MTELDPAAPQAEPPPHGLFAPAAEPPLIDHAPEPPPRAPDPLSPRRRGGTPLPLTFLITAALAGAGYYGWTHPAPATLHPQAADPAPLQALTTRIDALEKQPQPSPDAATDLARKLDELTTRVTALATRQDQIAAQSEKLTDLLAQKNAVPATAADQPPPDTTAAQVPALAAAQQTQDAKAIGDRLAQQKSALDQAQTDQKTALAALSDRLAKLEQAPPAPVAVPAITPQAVDALNQRLAKLEQTATSAPPAAGADTVNALASRIEKLEQGAGQTAGAAHDASRAVRLASAEAALAAGQPLGAIPGAPPALQKYATAAPPTEETLRAAFPDVAARARAASVPAAEHRSFLDRLLARAQQSVVVRQGDHVLVGDPAAGILARAQDQVAAGDLRSALQTLSALNAPAAAAIQDWTAEAQSLLDARTALANLAAHG